MPPLYRVPNPPLTPHNYARRAACDAFLRDRSRAPAPGTVGGDQAFGTNVWSAGTFRSPEQALNARRLARATLNAALRQRHAHEQARIRRFSARFGSVEVATLSVSASAKVDAIIFRDHLASGGTDGTGDAFDSDTDSDTFNARAEEEHADYIRDRHTELELAARLDTKTWHTVVSWWTPHAVESEPAAVAELRRRLLQQRGTAPTETHPAHYNCTCRRLICTCRPHFYADSDIDAHVRVFQDQDEPPDIVHYNRRNEASQAPPRGFIPAAHIQASLGITPVVHTPRHRATCHHAGPPPVHIMDFVAPIYDIEAARVEEPWYEL